MFIMPYVTRFTQGRFPLGVALVVLLCVFVFFVFQSPDEKRYAVMGEYYAGSALPAIELPAYADYLRAQWDTEQLEQLTYFMNAKAVQPALDMMEADTAFMARLRSGDVIADTDPRHEDWQFARDQYDGMGKRLFTERFKFDTEAPGVLTAITHQFLHGSTGHLLGNMVVLMLVGPAVEALIGLGPFLLIYLVGGVGAVASHYLFTLGAPGGLVGASGAISAVMGAFAVLLGMRRIPFFYFVIVYFDVIKAPALLALPIWLVNEALQFFWLGDASQVAYGAHFGGLLAGALLVLPFRRRALAVLDEVDTQDDVAPAQTPASPQAALTQARRLMSTQRFDEARRAYGRAAAHAQGDAVVLRECLNVAKLSPASEEYHAIVAQVLRIKDARADTHAWVLESFRDYLKEAKPLPRLSPEVAEALIERFGRARCLPELERVVRVLHASAPSHPRLASLHGQAIEVLSAAGDAARASALHQLKPGD